MQSKEDEIKKMNNNAISSITEFKLGNQVWMATDLNIIPSNQSYQIVNDNKIQDIKTGSGIILYGLNNENKSVCPSGWRIPTTTDWETLVKTLGGDKKAAGELLMVGKGSGFETTFPIIYWQESIGYNQAKLMFSSNSPGGYLSINPENGNITVFRFGFDYQLNNYPHKSFVPCRCIKE